MLVILIGPRNKFSRKLIGSYEIWGFHHCSVKAFCLLWRYAAYLVYGWRCFGTN